MRISSEVQKIIEQVKRKYDPEKIIIFGSYSHGKPQKYSDVDILIIKNTKETFMERLRRVAKFIDSNLGTDIIVYTPSELKKILADKYAFFTRDIIKKGKVVYEKK